MYLCEIYTKNPETGEGGWDIEFIIAMDRKDAETYPNFDEFILIEGRFGDNWFAALNSGYPMTNAAAARCAGADLEVAQ